MTLTMKGASRLSSVAIASTFGKELSKLDSAAISRFSADLFVMVRTLDSSISLRRSFSDSARVNSDKESLARAIFEKSVTSTSLTFLFHMIAQRWSSPRDLVDLLEALAVESQAAAAAKDGTLDLLEEEFFAFSRIIADNSALRSAFADRSNVAGQKPKSELVSVLLKGKATPAAITLISVLVDHPRGRNIESGLLEYAAIVSGHRNRLIVHVVTAAELTPVQVERLTKALSKKIGAEVRVNVEIDKSVVGGISIRFGDELIDGTLLTRLVEADRALASKSA